MVKKWWLRIKEKFPGPAAETALAMDDVGEKEVEYSKSKPRRVLWWLRRVLKSLTWENGMLKKV